MKMRLGKKPTLILLGLVAAPVVLIDAYELAFQNRVYHGISVQKIPLDRQTQAQATSTLDRLLNASPSASLKFSYDDQEKTIALSELGFSYNASASAQKAIQIGRNDSLWQNLKTQFRLLFRPVDRYPDYTLDPLAKEKLFLELHALVDQPPLYPQLSIEQDQVVVSQSQSGQILNEAGLEAILRNRFSQRVLTSPIILPVETVNPVINQTQVASARQLLTVLLDSPLTLTASNQTTALKAQDAVEFVQPAQPVSDPSFPKQPNENIFAPVPGITEPLPAGLVNQAKVTAYLESAIAPTVYQPPRDAAFRVENNRVVVFTPSQEGRQLDLQQAASLLTERLETLAQTTNQEVDETLLILQLPVVVSQPNILTSAANTLGIETLIGKGISHFKGSIENRVFNIELASARFNGVLIEPGKEISFNEIVGEVSGQTGFKQAYVIKQGRTVLDDGGGVCQVSTTLFRAAMDAGLPIAERLAHAYRVAYYEQGFDPGLDATVYAPSVDLKFRNDTPAHLLIQTKTNRQTATLTFEIYGTDDRRRSAITKPVVSNVQAPPEPLYQDDPALPKGTTKQVDWAAWGAKVTYVYKVTRAGETIFEQTFISNYRPWQAVYLVGTKEG